MKTLHIPSTATKNPHAWLLPHNCVDTQLRIGQLVNVFDHSRLLTYKSKLITKWQFEIWHPGIIGMHDFALGPFEGTFAMMGSKEMAPLFEYMGISCEAFFAEADKLQPLESTGAHRLFYLETQKITPCAG